jgi:hypothetical protein
MAYALAIKVRVKWEPRVDPPPCEHLTLKLEPSGAGSFTGNFYCIACGESIVPPKPIISLRPRGSLQHAHEAERIR